MLAQARLIPLALPDKPRKRALACMQARVPQAFIGGNPQQSRLKIP
jgi:hypothetical protein